ncbi:Dyp-type peroxidase domain-containing protein [Actinacidiphila sp. ITFR-21]|uniref:Dyp-type peroxidase domain-containing protein n=1 Tax=Actinacidiphila sp. ITFR-21 TaxID=3075199 RepID=UPI00288A9DFE|nr:Dyp-type peroxidase domain-containing protein [Streptomyces sp. ITFR-21]WNI14512.1 Dyp-type peroxidase [Streptomyces sp. ITFR-21]
MTDTHEPTGTGDLRRRGFLRGAALGVGAVGAVAGGAAPLAGGTASASAPAPSARRGADFHGPHQAGIAEPVTRSTAFLSFDVTAADRRELTELLHTVTDRARFLATGGTPAQLGITDSPSDNRQRGRPPGLVTAP